MHTTDKERWIVKRFFHFDVFCSKSIVERALSSKIIEDQVNSGISLAFAVSDFAYNLPS